MSGAIDPDSYTPVYVQLADILRSEIKKGRLQPGEYLPAEAALEQEYGLSRTSVRKALQLLRAEGLIETSKGHGSYVREKPERRPLPLHPGDSAIADRGPRGVPQVVVTRADGTTETYPADEVEIVVRRR